MKRERCELHHANSLDAWCTREVCIYWRLLQAQDEDISSSEGCGLQHFSIIENLSPEMAKWLLDIKSQLENTNPDLEKSRITFKRRESK
ncbi:MAG: hypothetical protein ACYC5A_03720 [Thermoleophilia bacterium]